MQLAYVYRQNLLLKKNMITKKKPALGNPVLIASAAQAGVSVIPFLIKTAVILGVGYYVFTRFQKRFISLKENNSYPAANITNNQAATRAETIHGAMKGYGNGFQIVATNISGLNYNGWTKLYNAFGNRQGSVPFSDKMNLVEWFTDQFSDEELAQLRFLVPNVF